jgi:hypothetical protein
MIVKDVITILLDYPMDAPCLAFTKEEDLNDVIGEELPDLRFGTIKIGSGEDGKEEIPTVVMIGNFKKYAKGEAGQ